jgi:hypothetical protein
MMPARFAFLQLSPLSLTLRTLGRVWVWPSETVFELPRPLKPPEERNRV